MIPARLRGWRLPFLNDLAPTVATSLPGEYHLHPHYRMPRPLDPLLLKTQAGLDGFVTERYADEIGAILGQWSSALLASPQAWQAIENVLAETLAALPLSQPNRESYGLVPRSRSVAIPSIVKTNLTARRSCTNYVQRLATCPRF